MTNIDKSMLKRVNILSNLFHKWVNRTQKRELYQT